VQEISIGNEYITNSRDSNGSQRKYLKDEKFYKVDTFGTEGLSEYLMSLVLKYSNVKSYVKYEQCKINGKNGCVSESFLKENQEFISLNKIYRSLEYKDLTSDIFKIENVNYRFVYLVDWFKRNINLDLAEYLAGNIALDLIGLNPDRHFNNLGVILEDNVFKVAPIFDNGQSLGANYNITPPNYTIDECVHEIATCTISGLPYIQYGSMLQYFYNNHMVKYLFKVDIDALLNELSNEPETRNKLILIHQLRELRYKI
jgi:hypothetical protein